MIVVPTAAWDLAPLSSAQVGRVGAAFSRGLVLWLFFPSLGGVVLL